MQTKQILATLIILISTTQVTVAQSEWALHISAEETVTLLAIREALSTSFPLHNLQQIPVCEQVFITLKTIPLLQKLR